jgi:amino acid adenylation domain-containing protein
MSAIDQCLIDLAAHGIELWTDGVRLKYSAPPDGLTPALLAQLQRHKAAILQVLTACMPLSYGQQALWLTEQTAPGSYNVALALRIHGIVDAAALARAGQQMVERHSILRTVYAMQDGAVVGRLQPPSQSVDFVQIDATAWSDVAVQQEATVAYQQLFDLERGPLLRLRLFTQSRDRHLLLLALHHIAVDGWSIWYVLDEWLTLYQGERSGRPVTLPPVASAYADFVQWEAERLRHEGAQLLAYWREALIGQRDDGEALPVLQLPTDHVRPVELTARGAVQPCLIDAKLSQALKMRAQSAGVSLNMLLLAAFQVLLRRYSGQEEILVAVPFDAARDRPEFARTIGYMVNPLVLRVDLAGQATFTDLLHQVRQTVLDALAHRHYPFPRLVQELQPQRNPHHHPIVQAMFLLYKLPTTSEWIGRLAAGETVTWADLTLTPVTIPQLAGHFDLMLELTETAEGLTGSWKYNRVLFEPSTIERMAGHFQALLAGIVANPDQPIDDIPLLTAAERHQILIEWNNTQTDYPNDTCIHHLFEAQVARTPEAVAVVFEDQQLTYGELNARANQLAHHLQALEVGPEVLVGLCVERSLELVVGVLGILKAGSAYLPLDPTYPPERLAFMVQDAAPAVIVTQCRHQHLFPTDVKLVCFDTDQIQGEQQVTSNLRTAVTSAHLAYVIYTSGSTGQPKGVLLEHGGLCNLAQAQIAAFGVKPGHRVLQVASLNFDASISEIVMALGAGATLVMATSDALFPGPALTQTLQQQAITHVTLVPTALALLEPEALPHLQTLIVAGEACPAASAARWPQGRQFFNAYGPTETTVCATIMDCTTWRGQEKSPPIGRPLANMQVYILDAQRQPVPIGVPGELYISGVGVARGYLNRPRLTQDKFVANPFGAGRLYKTGDLCRWLPDSNLEFLARLDQQVKVRGFRIELGEIETVLARHPSIAAAVVLAREDVPGEKRLVAYIVPYPQSTVRGQKSTSDDHGISNAELVAQDTVGLLTTSSDLKTQDLRPYLQQKLPGHMVPYVFIMLEALPLTPNGKIDRKALPAPDVDYLASTATYAPPRTATEEALVSIWQKLLGIEPIGITGNFFELGGHSLLLAHLAVQIRLTFQVDLPLPLLYRSPTIEQLSLAVLAKQAERTSDTTIHATKLITLQPGDMRLPLFCIPGLGDTAHSFVDLVQCLDQAQPVYALHHIGLEDEARITNTTINIAATQTREAIQSQQPDGPYCLLGHSIGGHVAFEAAQQLAKNGHQVALLALLDSYAPGLIGTFDPTWLYVPQDVVPLHLTLFRASEASFPRTGVQPEAYLGWDQFAGMTIEPHCVPGNHYTMLRPPNVGALAERLVACLAQVAMLEHQGG